MDKNNEKQIEKLKDAARSEEGELILDFLKEEIEDEFNFDNIKEDLDSAEKGIKFELTRKARNFINSKIAFLTEE